MSRSILSYPFLEPLSTRWSDNDQYGHVNNSVYYTYFDAVANAFLIRRCGLVPVPDAHPLPEADAGATGDGGPIGLVVASDCRYHASVEFPRRLLAGLAIAKVGKSSVTYRLAIFDAETQPTLRKLVVASQSGIIPNEALRNAVAADARASSEGQAELPQAAAVGHFTHVFVDRKSRRPVAMTKQMKEEFERIVALEPKL
ncbi:hypothetical protein PYCC9005_002339 [Savitreella phatthalungensis]